MGVVDGVLRIDVVAAGLIHRPIEPPLTSAFPCGRWFVSDAHREHLSYHKPQFAQILCSNFGLGKENAHKDELIKIDKPGVLRDSGDTGIVQRGSCFWRLYRPLE